MELYTVNLEAGRPTVAVARQLMLSRLRTARAGGVRVVKLIHGYGSSGAGGAIRADVHRQLAEKKAAGSIRAWVRGEDFSPFDADSRAILEACPPLRKDPDLIRQNHGVTFVLL